MIFSLWGSAKAIVQVFTTAATELCLNASQLTQISMLRVLSAATQGQSALTLASVFAGHVILTPVYQAVNEVNRVGVEPATS